MAGTPPSRVARCKRPLRRAAWTRIGWKTNASSNASRTFSAARSIPKHDSKRRSASSCCTAEHARCMTSVAKTEASANSLRRRNFLLEASRKPSASLCPIRNGLVEDALVDEFDDVLRGRPREKNLSDAGFLQSGNVRFGDDAAEDHGHVVHAFVVQQAHELRA